MRSSAPTIELTGVRKTFGRVVAVDGVSLKLRNAEIFGLLGRNGAGKTTLVDMITKVTRPT
jgi:ABC-type multidrug transport system ATPase subunit